MKKSLIFSLAFSTLFLGIGAQTAFADEENEREKTVTSEASVELLGNDETPTEPLDPDNPDNPGTPDTDSGENTEMEGPLSLDWIPNLNFGSQKITGKVENYELVNLKPYIQVTDKRGTGEGWKVGVSLSSFTSDEGNSFDGVISFSNGSVKTTTGNSSSAPVVSDTSITSGQSKQNILTASNDQGLGTWVKRWYPTDEGTTTNDSIVLTTNTDGIKAGNYTATITWIISAAP